MIPYLKYDIIIIGAGVAGLRAGLELYEKKVNFLILEASSEIFGRVRTLYDFADFPIELGAECIHGNNNDLYFLAKSFIQNNNYSFIKNNYKELYWVPDLQKLLEYDDIIQAKSSSVGKELKEALKFDKLIGSYNKEKDLSIKDFKEMYLKDNQFKDIFVALSSHDKGAGETEAGMYGLQEDEENWGTSTDDSYEEFLFKKGNFSEMFSIYFQKILDRVEKNCVVSEIDYQNDQIQITLQNGLIYSCKKAIVTVSLGILKSDLIKFSPALPAEKKEAIHCLGFSGGIKILIKLKKPFWPKKTLFIFANGQGIIPVYWVTSAGGRSRKDFVLTGFFMGNEAKNYVQKSDFLIIQVKLQLSKLFNISEAHLEENVMSTYVKNWFEEPFTKGGYSFITINNGYKNHRKNLAKNIRKKIFFAGEATSINFSSTIQGGMITGFKAAQEAVE